MKDGHVQVGWGLWLRWVLLTTVGDAVGWALASIVSLIVSGIIKNLSLGIFGTNDGLFSRDWAAYWFSLMFVYPPVFGLVGAAIVGGAQWLILRRRISHAAWWLFVTTIGGVVGTAAGFFVTAGLPAVFEDIANVLTGTRSGLNSYFLPAAWAVLGAVGGAVVGILQWIVLRGFGWRGAVWVFATICGGALGLGLGLALGMGLFHGQLLLDSFAASEQVLSNPLSAGVSGAIAGVSGASITGIALVWLLRLTQERPTSESTPARPTDARAAHSN